MVRRKRGDGSTPEHNMPYPEIVETQPQGEPYQILDATGRSGLPSIGLTDKIRRKLLVPLNRSGRPVSRHELAHVKWSPLRLPRVRYDARVLMAVEDARINLGLAAVGIPVDLATAERSDIRSLATRDLRRGEVAAFVLRAIASLGTNAERDVCEPADDDLEVRDLTERLLARVSAALENDRQRNGGAVASFRHGMRVARDVARQLEALGLLERGASRRPRNGVVCCSWDRLGTDSDADADTLEARRARRDGGETLAGHMRITVAPLELRCPAKVGAGRVWRPATEGSVVRWLHRGPIDGAIFRRPVRRDGGSVLIDTSGSMSLDSDDIDRILRQAPSTTLVAIYSGKGEAGELRVVARAGRRARAEHLQAYGKGNIVDLPALQWLARQRAPRIWISDGNVTGRNDRGSAAILRRCQAICRRARIGRVPDAEHAAKALRR